MSDFPVMYGQVPVALEKKCHCKASPERQGDPGSFTTQLRCSNAELLQT